MKKIIIPIVIVVILGAIFAGLVYTSNIIPIGAISDNLEKYRGTEVTIIGNVTDRIVYQDEVIFKLEDESSSITVHTRGEAPALRSEVLVKGRVESMVKIGPHEFGILIEASEVRAPYLWEKLA